MRTICVIVVLVALASELTGAQQPKPAFEVASVKRNTLGAPGFGGPTATSGARPTGFVAVNVTLSSLIRSAYGVDAPPVVGGPSWAQTYRFDINARAATEVSREQVYAMLRTLLADRFKLVVATEQRLRDAYTLRLARADGRLGPDLRKAPDSCEVTYPKNPLERLKLMPRPSNGAGPSEMNVCATIENVAGAIGASANATVIDETGLTGRWDFVISHAGLQSGMMRGLNGVNEGRPSIFVAIEEQLGLKLERRREQAPYDVLVIKSVELPSEN